MNRVAPSDSRVIVRSPPAGTVPVKAWAAAAGSVLVIQ